MKSSLDEKIWDYGTLFLDTSSALIPAIMGTAGYFQVLGSMSNVFEDPNLTPALLIAAFGTSIHNKRSVSELNLTDLVLSTGIVSATYEFGNVVNQVIQYFQ